MHPSFSGLVLLFKYTRFPSTDIGQEESEAMTSLAMQLYGLIHARYILTTHGLAAMHHKYLHGGFGKCPRHLCAQQNVVPVSRVVSVPNPVFFRKQQTAVRSWWRLAELLFSLFIYFVAVFVVTRASVERSG